jgi:hypothetical protein
MVSSRWKLNLLQEQILTCTYVDNIKALHMHGKESRVHSNGAAHLVLIYMRKCFPVW